MNSAYQATCSNAAYHARGEFAAGSSTRPRKSATSERASLAYISRAIDRVPALHTANHECTQNLRSIALNVRFPSNHTAARSGKRDTDFTSYALGTRAREERRRRGTSARRENFIKRTIRASHKALLYVGKFKFPPPPSTARKESLSCISTFC